MMQVKYEIKIWIPDDEEWNRSGSFSVSEEPHSKLAKYLVQQAEEADKRIDDYLDRHGLTLVAAQTQSEKEDGT